MTTQEVANQLVQWCREGKFENIYKELYSHDAWSIEPEGAPSGKIQGMEAIYEKGKRWNDMLDKVHSSEVSDPIVADNYFACTMKMSVSMKGVPEPVNMDEVCIYHVQEGKIVSEQFFYTPDPQLV